MLWFFIFLPLSFCLNKNVFIKYVNSKKKTPSKLYNNFVAFQLLGIFYDKKKKFINLLTTTIRIYFWFWKNERRFVWFRWFFDKSQN